MEIGGWNPEKRLKLEVHLRVTGKMLIAAIIRMYVLFDGEAAAKKIRETGAAEGERLEIGSCHTSKPNY